MNLPEKIYCDEVSPKTSQLNYIEQLTTAVNLTLKFFNCHQRAYSTRELALSTMSREFDIKQCV